MKTFNNRNDSDREQCEKRIDFSCFFRENYEEDLTADQQLFEAKKCGVGQRLCKDFEWMGDVQSSFGLKTIK